MVVKITVNTSICWYFGDSTGGYINCMTFLDDSLTIIVKALTLYLPFNTFIPSLELYPKKLIMII